jgi:hypothetical protein
MPGPHDFAVRINAARLVRLSRSLTNLFALRSHAHATSSRPPHPALHVRDDRDTPLLSEAGWREASTYFGKTEVKYFSREDWTAQITLNRLANFDFARTGFFGPKDEREGAADVEQCPTGESPTRIAAVRSA